MAEEEEGPLSMTASSSTSNANLTLNPFEMASLDSMHLPAFSPSVFKQSQGTASSKKKSGFRWSIDQMSLLFPADIDELPQQQDTSILTKEKEDQVQEAINQFFSQDEVVPSPWSGAKPMKHVTFSPQPPSVSIMSEHSADNSVCSSTNGSFVGGLTGKVDASCQTNLTLPFDFDLEALLGKGRFQYTKSSVESFPVLGLRRKLFTQSESSSNGCPTASPLSAGSRESGPFSPSISPIKSSQEYRSPAQKLHGPGTPNSIESQFSSSPISSVKATPRRPAPHILYQASPLCGVMESPSMSPIREIAPHTAVTPPSPISHTHQDMENGKHISPHGPHSSPLNHLPKNIVGTSLLNVDGHHISTPSPHMSPVGHQPQDMVDTSLFSGNPPVFKSSVHDGVSEDEGDGEGGMKDGRKDFTLGLTREFSPIQKTGDQISSLDVPGCSSRLHGTQEESIMDTSLISNKGDGEECLQTCPGSPEGNRCFFSLEASTGFSPIPKTGDLQLHQQVPVTPCIAKAENRHQSSQSKHRHKTVSFHIGAISPIRGETGEDHNSCQTVPITSSRVHESMMDTSLFSLEERSDRETSQRGTFPNAELHHHLGELPNAGLHHTGDPPYTGKGPDAIGLASDSDYLRKDGKAFLTSPTEDLDDFDTPAAKMEPIVGSHENDTLDRIKQNRLQLNKRSENGAKHEQAILEKVKNRSPFGHKDGRQNEPSLASNAVNSEAERIVTWESCDRGSASWVNESESSSWHVQRQSDFPQLESSGKGTNPLTSTMRHGTPFGMPFAFNNKSQEDTSSAMDFSSVSMITTDMLEKPEPHMHDVTNEPKSMDIKRDPVPSCDISGGATKLSEHHSPRLSYERVIPTHMKISRSFDSLQKYAEDQENEDDWLMASLSESDLQGGRMSTDVQHRAMSSSLPEVQEGHKSGLSHKSELCSQHGVLTELKQGNISHTFQSTMYNRHDMSQGMVVQEGHKLGLTHKTDICSRPDGHVAENGEKGVLNLPRPVSADFLLRSLKCQADSGYNTHSANVSMDVIDGENSS